MLRTGNFENRLPTDSQPAFEKARFEIHLNNIYFLSNLIIISLLKPIPFSISSYGVFLKGSGSL